MQFEWIFKKKCGTGEDEVCVTYYDDSTKQRVNREVASSKGHGILTSQVLDDDRKVVNDPLKTSSAA